MKHATSAYRPPIIEHVARSRINLDRRGDFTRWLRSHAKNLPEDENYGPLANTLPLLAQGDVLPGGLHNYTVVGPLGSGSTGMTYEAKLGDGSGQRVAIKTLSLSRMSSWKQLDLFEREAGMLGSVRHASVPSYLEHFETQSDKDKAWYLVQHLAPGQSLGSLLRSGARLELEEIRHVARRVLGVLDHLASLSPPVIHRDLKPDNIIYDPTKKDEASGGVYVVDFGGVQSVDAGRDMSGTTMMVGTYGYMPPEQFQGRASVKSDLYGLGATLLTLATGRSPASFPQSRLKIDFSQEEGVMPLDLKRVISGLLEPVEEDRLSAKDAMRILDGDIVSSKLSVSELLSLASKKTSPRAGKQQIGRVSWLKDHESLVISIKPQGIEEDALSISTFTIAWNAFVFIWTRLALIGAGPIFAAFSLPFW